MTSAFRQQIVSRIQTRVMVRESILVDAQSLVQKLLNEKYGNPRDCEETDPRRTKQLFKEQRRHMAHLTGWSKKKVKRFFSDNADIKIKDLAEILLIFNYELELKEKKRK